MAGLTFNRNLLKQAIEELYAAFAPKKQDYELYVDLFGSRQRRGTCTEKFIGEKRDILACMNYRFSKQVRMDMLYGLMLHEIR